MAQCAVFQQLDIDYIIGESHREILPHANGPAAILRIFGVTKEGHSVCCHVHGFQPYFYISCYDGMSPDDITRFQQILEGRMREANRNSKVPKFITRIEMVQKRSIMYYQEHKSRSFLKIIVALPTMVASCRGSPRGRCARSIVWPHMLNLEGFACLDLGSSFIVVEALL
eukprot:Gb_15178 [translate_table: standard]